MKRKISILLISLIIGQFLFGQASDTVRYYSKNTKNTQALGVNAGFTTGVGLTYKMWDKKNEYQIAFLPLIDKDNSYVSLGFTYLRGLKDFEYSRFLFYSGLHFTNFFQDNEKFITNFGTGFGAEVHAYDIEAQIMIGYGIYAIPDNIMTRPTIELGFFYEF
jgi:hypothetical protein